ncbi:hypothetical protein G7054_g3672 [Neopestalotiopsis clavispora]|nr:hypothetical protein G7054_g3672 [Neopestalotiopsis clavispora]
MPSKQVFQIHPYGWEQDPEEERLKVSTIDRTPVTTYNHYVVYFRVDDADKDRAVDVLRAGLEKTLSQAKYFCSTIEKDPEGGHSFVKKKDSTVKLVLQRLDLPGDNYPSLDEIEAAYFSARSLGDINTWSIPEMTWGERPEAEPDNSPVVAAYQINLTKGGLLFSMHSHHYASDVMGWHNFTHQLADNCYAICNSTPFPSWDPACVDALRFTKDLPEKDLVDGPPIPQRHPDHPEQQAILFHLPSSKAEELKRLALPTESGSHWVSTYDAMCAYIWRVMTKVRADFYKPADLSQKLYWGEAINMRPRLHNPPVPERMLRAIVAGGFSDTYPDTALSIAQVIRDAPLSQLASCIRYLTESCTEKHLEALVDLIAPIRDKRSISLRVDAHPPMSTFVTDHRSSDVSGFDFGFGKPITYRHLWGESITAGLILIYAPLRPSPNADEGCMFTITMEKELVETLRADPAWNSYFEYRGID